MSKVMAAGQDLACLLKSPLVMNDAMVAGLDIAWLLKRQAERHAEKLFLTWAPFDGALETWSYADFYRSVLKVAGGLKQSGLKPGDRLILHAQNSPELLMAWFASAVIGSVAVTTNAATTRAEMSHFFDNARPRFAICDANLSGVLTDRSIEQCWQIGLDTSSNEAKSFAELRGAEEVDELRPADPFQPLAIQYTSGTTSKPKAVLWTHANGIWGARLSALQQQLTADDTYLVFLPFFHTNAQSYSILPTLWAGGTVVLQPKFSASRFWPVALNHKCTRTSLVPFCLAALRSQPVPSKHSFRTWGFGVAHPLAEAQFGVRFIGWWGMTETISQVIVTDPNVAHPAMAMGYASLAYEIEIRDGTTRAQAGEVGKLWVRGVRGVSLFKEYYRDPEATSAAFDAKGWFSTGDLARQNEDGSIFFHGREADIIKCGGENIAPAEIEAVIATVAGVTEIAVVGQKSRLYGEVPIAFVGGPDSEELRIAIDQVCNERLSRFKRPRHVHFKPELPKAAIGKIAKHLLRNELPETD